MLGSWAWWRTIDGGFAEDGLKYDRNFTRALTEALEAWRTKQYGTRHSVELELNG
jgi:hypothetical protein